MASNRYREDAGEILKRVKAFEGADLTDPKIVAQICADPGVYIVLRDKLLAPPEPPAASDTASIKSMADYEKHREALLRGEDPFAPPTEEP